MICSEKKARSSISLDDSGPPLLDKTVEHLSEVYSPTEDRSSAESAGMFAKVNPFRDWQVLSDIQKDRLWAKLSVSDRADFLNQYYFGLIEPETFKKLTAQDVPNNFSKIIHNDVLKKWVEFCRHLEKADDTWPMLPQKLKIDILNDYYLKSIDYGTFESLVGPNPPRFSDVVYPGGGPALKG